MKKQLVIASLFAAAMLFTMQIAADQPTRVSHHAHPILDPYGGVEANFNVLIQRRH